ncbi:unnamed protein product [Schistosoma mattheei]|uniref:Uncharacterized protein n=1 Tax=Schistosoma mattheei TaxID=31246 RepID=A0A3P8CNK3_9TREM|nr:unnamed protein product [Schistosoma mattheei]
MIRCPSLQSVGTCYSSQILLKRMWSILAVTATSASNASAEMLSGPAALPLLTCLMAMLISPVAGGQTLIGRSVCAASMLGVFSGADQFKSSLKCSTHLFCCASMLVFTSMQLLVASAKILSGLAALPLLVCLMAMLISPIVDGQTSIGTSVGAASILGGFSVAGRYNSSLKCSTHLFRC